MAVFEIYKPQLGKYVRMGTAAGLALILAVGLAWVGKSVIPSAGPYVIAAVLLVLGLAGAYGIFWICNAPKYVDFFEKTESEMRKVTWPTREDVIRSTQVVIFLTFMLAFMLFVVDAGFNQLFLAMHLYSGTK